MESNSRNNLTSVVTLHTLNFTVNQLLNIDIIGITDPWKNEQKKLTFSDSVKQFQDNLTILLSYCHLNVILSYRVIKI